MSKENILTNRPALMPSEDFQYLVLGNKKNVYDYVFVGIANPAVVTKASNEGKPYPFFLHNADYQVDLSAIPLGTEIGATALLEMFRK